MLPPGVRRPVGDPRPAGSSPPGGHLTPRVPKTVCSTSSLSCRGTFSSSELPPGVAVPNPGLPPSGDAPLPAPTTLLLKIPHKTVSSNTAVPRFQGPKPTGGNPVHFCTPAMNAPEEGSKKTAAVQSHQQEYNSQDPMYPAGKALDTENHRTRLLTLDLEMAKTVCLQAGWSSSTVINRQ